MSTYRGHYLPVEARREVLRIYRNRRQRGSQPGGRGIPLAPMAAMLEAVEYFEGWLANTAAYGAWRKGETVQDYVDRLRAADFYMGRMYSKSERFRNRGRA